MALEQRLEGRFVTPAGEAFQELTVAETIGAVCRRSSPQAL
jgi:hypothetical protein